MTKTRTVQPSEIAIITLSHGVEETPCASPTVIRNPNESKFHTPTCEDVAASNRVAMEDTDNADYKTSVEFSSPLMTQ